MMTLRHLAGITTLSLLAQAVTAETNSLIQVEAEPLPLLGGNRMIPEEGRGIAADGGELLRSVPGVSGARLGGKGVDPVIRGQGQNRLNILLDGAYVFGGCPNRMDPPSSFANIESYDQVTVLKGVQTLRYGGGGSGGTVLFERGRYTFADKDFHGKASGSYSGNGSRHAEMVDIAIGTEEGYARMIGSRSGSNNYKDGAGAEVRSGYEEGGVTVIGGWTPDANTLLELTLEATRGDDVLYAGSMDAPIDDNDTLRVQFEKKNLGGAIKRVHAEIYNSDVTHLMDNYSLRTGVMAAMRMGTEADSRTRGLRLSALIEQGDVEWTVGTDYQFSNREALMYSRHDTTHTLAAVMWPDVEIAQTGLFTEAEWMVSPASRLKGGLRIDRASAEAPKANAVAATMGGINTANGLYQAYYGTTAQEQNDTNVGALLRYERDFDGGTWFVDVNRSERVADATERYMARNNATAGSRWVGNPNLKPELHTQLEGGANWGGANWNFGGVLYADRVSDYILRDKAAGQSGILLSDGGTIYRNVDARLWGLELDGGWRLNERWKLSGNLAYVRARNTSDSRDIAQTPPLEASVTLAYDTGLWNAAATLRGADRQSRIDTASGLDLGETAGWSTLDLRGSYRMTRTATLDAGIDNLFDENYAQHLNQANAFDPSVVQINEPGRSAWVKANFKW